MKEGGEGIGGDFGDEVLQEIPGVHEWAGEEATGAGNQEA